MNTFPLELNKHILFCAIGIIFFLFQFFRQGFKYQIMTAAAIGATLLLYISDSTAWRYTVGVLELVLIIAIFIVMSVEKKNAEKKAAAATENGAVTAENSEISETADNGDKNNE